ncbi:hypothetical protein GDO86_019201, partial [Hymenochirus boettgeri]
MEDVDFADDPEEGEMADNEEWETEDEGVEEGTDPHDDSELTFSKHTGTYPPTFLSKDLPRHSFHKVVPTPPTFLSSKVRTPRHSSFV